MWYLLRNLLPPPGLAGDRSQSLKEEILRSQYLQQEMHKLMNRMGNLGFQDAKEYQQAMEAYNDLSHAISGATRELRSWEDKQVQEHRAMTGLITQHDFTGVTPLKGTLGIAGRRGVISEGDDVMNLQRFLGVVGYKIAVNGRFDGETRGAVVKFQIRYNLHTDGQVGAETRMLINAMIKGK